MFGGGATGNVTITVPSQLPQWYLDAAASLMKPPMRYYLPIGWVNDYERALADATVARAMERGCVE